MAFRRTTRRRYRPYGVPGLIGGGLGLAGRLMQRRKGWSVTGTKKKESSGQGVTEQFDKRTIYRRKKMPYKKKKRWISFTKKSSAVQMKSLGTTAIVKNDRISRTWTGQANYQDTCAIALYGKAGQDVANSEVGMRDLLDITTAEPDFNTVNEKAIFTSATLDMTFHNTGTFKLEVDVYQMVYAGRGAPGPGIKTDLNAAVIGTREPDLTAQTAFLSTRGLTPFDISSASARGYRVMKKIKYFCGAGEVFTYQIRDPKNYVIPGYNILSAQDSGECALRYKTKFLVFIVKAVPSQADDGSSGQYAIGVTRSYHYKISKTNENFLKADF